MNICIICEKESEYFVCHDCIKNINLEEAINNIINTKDMENKYYILNELIDKLPSPQKELYSFKRSFYSQYIVDKNKREDLYQQLDYLLNSESISDDDKLALKIAYITALLNDYKYDEAEKYANKIDFNDFFDYRALYGLASYYLYTRRYDKSKEIIKKMYINSNDILLNERTKKLDAELNKRIEGKDYLPALPENREKYKKFIVGLGIAFDEPRISSKQPEKIPIGEYPIPEETLNAGFKTFVAYDFETTGLNSSKDSLTEIGAIKVIDGKIIESKEFVFQELVHPYKKSIPKSVEEKTHITNEMVKDARKVWEAFNDFADFIGDNILIGYNNIMFDRSFFVRAGRLSNRIVTNKQFDVMKYEKRISSFKTSNHKLNTVANYFGIENPQAHRALADAITTAKLYLKLLEIDKENLKSATNRF